MAFEENWANDYVTTLAGSGQVMDATTSLSCVVSSAAGAPATPFRLKIITGGVPEYILVTTVAGTTFSWPGMGNRGLEGTSAAAHNGGDTAGCPITAGGLTTGLVRQLLAGASGNLTLSPAGGQGVVTADILTNPTFTGLVSGAIGFRDSRGQAGANLTGMLFSKKNGDGTTNKVSFTGIPAGFSHARLRWKARTTSATNGEDGLALQFNGDTTATYSNERLNVVGAGNPGTAVTAQDGGVLGTSLTTGFVPGGGVTDANSYGEGLAEITGYADAFRKTVRGSSVVIKAFAALGVNVELIVGAWQSTAAINQIDVLASAGFWTTAAVFWLYLDL